MTDLSIPRGKYVGARINRVEDPALLAGEARYLADLTLPRMLHVAFVRAPVAHADVRAVDVSRARELAGVEAVFVGGEISAQPLVDAVAHATLLKTPQPALASDRVRYVGEAVAAVVARDAYIAEDAASLVEVDYDERGAVMTVEDAAADGAPQLFDDVPSNTVYDERKSYGDPDAIFASADRVYRQTLRSNRFLAAPMEARGVLADFERASGKLTVWSSTQTPEPAGTSKAFELPSERLR